MSDKELIPAYLSLGAQALAPIILGSFKSLKVRPPFDFLSLEEYN